VIYNGAFRILLAVFLLLVVVGGAVDLVLDHSGDRLSLHVLFEMATILAAVLLAGAVWSGWWRTERSVEALRVSLRDRSDERDAWRSSAQRALDGLAAAIDQEFRRWTLTPTEREVALLLLKGGTHKQIAQATGRSERTVRQHAGTVYQKAGIGSRAELSAHFLQDLILPGSDREIMSPAQRPDARAGIGPASRAEVVRV
jgi:DNA-binding CsgD family transcriptional regulator